MKSVQIKFICGRGVYAYGVRRLDAALGWRSLLRQLSFEGWQKSHLKVTASHRHPKGLDTALHAATLLRPEGKFLGKAP